MAGDGLVGVLDGRQQVGHAEPAGRVGDLDTAVHDFEEGGRWAMSFRFAHGYSATRAPTRQTDRPAGPPEPP